MIPRFLTSVIIPLLGNCKVSVKLIYVQDIQIQIQEQELEQKKYA
jgi:hypothetical protein